MEIANVYKTLVETPEGKRPLRTPMNLIRNGYTMLPQGLWNTLGVLGTNGVHYDEK
jgi:hypothetical protein